MHLRLTLARGRVCSSLRTPFVPQYLKNARYYSSFSHLCHLNTPSSRAIELPRLAHADSLRELLDRTCQKVLYEDNYGLKDVKDRGGEVTWKCGGQDHLPSSWTAGCWQVINRQADCSGPRLVSSSDSLWASEDLCRCPAGKISQALKRIGTESLLVVIDEVYKVARGINGDPARALFKMYDPEQNNSFLDH
ncbi:hypothetical protein BGY98DRAFT_594197 [Russula aff. rugulosa BPL654]|nr:hypothetical protein BGY98DRAFT_594197 [Russula aff. rugulosa BPL654]